MDTTGAYSSIDSSVTSSPFIQGVDQAPQNTELVSLDLSGLSTNHNNPGFPTDYPPLFQRHPHIVTNSHSYLAPQAIDADYHDEDGDNAFHMAVLFKGSPSVETVRTSIQEMAKTADHLANEQNDLKQTALHLAVVCNDPMVMEHLISAGASAKIQDANGCTPIHLACKYGYLDTIKLLIQLLASRCHEDVSQALDVCEYSGKGCLLYFVDEQKPSSPTQLEVLDLLLKYSSDPNQQDGKSGKTIIHLAAEQNNYILYAHLKSNHAKIIKFDAERYDGQYVELDESENKFNFIKY